MICPHNFPYYECRVCAQYFYGNSLENSHYELLEKLIREHKFSEARAYLSQNSFPCHMWAKLQKIWHESYYMEFEEKGKEIKAVAKFRLRKKYPPPMSIWNGEKLLYNLPQKTRDYLEVFFSKNEFATTEEKEEIAVALGMTESQVSNWFKNKRQRKRIHERKGNKNVKSYDSSLHNFILDGSTGSYYHNNCIQQMNNQDVSIFSEMPELDSSGQLSAYPQLAYPGSNLYPDYNYKNVNYNSYDDGRLRNTTNVNCTTTSYHDEKLYNANLWPDEYVGANHYYYGGGMHDSYIPYSQRKVEPFGDYCENYIEQPNHQFGFQNLEESKENIPQSRENAQNMNQNKPYRFRDQNF